MAYIEKSFGKIPCSYAETQRVKKFEKVFKQNFKQIVHNDSADNLAGLRE